MHLVHDPSDDPAATIPFDRFLTVDLRAGTIVEAEPFPEARQPAYKVRVDFGEGVGIKRSSARITEHYTPETLLGRQVIAVVNFPPRQIGPVRSEVLILGFPDQEGAIVLAGPDGPVPNGARMS